MEPKELIDRLADSFNTKNAAAFANLFAENAEFVTIFGKRMRGRDAINAGHKVVFETLLAGTHLNISGVDVMPLSDDIVMMHATWTRERLPEATPTTLPPGSGIFTFVACRDSDNWKLVGATNVQDTAPPGVPR